MKMNNFKVLLARKADNTELYALIKSLSNQSLTSYVLEILEKMAKPSGNTRPVAHATRIFYDHAHHGHGDPNDPSMDTNLETKALRHALTHHISEYKGARKAGLRTVADMHLKKMVPLMHLASQMHHESIAHTDEDGSAHPSKVYVDYPSPHAWEANYTGIERRTDKPSKLKRQTNGWKARLSVKPDSVMKDFRYFEHAPHAGHAAFDDLKPEHKDKAYPWEDIQIGTPAQVKAGKAHLPIEDREVRGYTPHPFDDHPALKSVEGLEAGTSIESELKMLNDMQVKSPHLHDMLERQKNMVMDKHNQDISLARNLHDNWMTGAHGENWLNMPNSDATPPDARPNHVHEDIDPIITPANADARAAKEIEVNLRHVRRDKEPSKSQATLQERKKAAELQAKFRRMDDQGFMMPELDPRLEREARRARAMSESRAQEPQAQQMPQVPQMRPSAEEEIAPTHESHFDDAFDVESIPHGISMPKEAWSRLTPKAKLAMHRSLAPDISKPPEHVPEEAYNTLSPLDKMRIHLAMLPSRED